MQSLAKKRRFVQLSPKLLQVTPENEVSTGTATENSSCEMSARDKMLTRWMAKVELVVPPFDLKSLQLNKRLYSAQPEQPDVADEELEALK